MSLDGGNTFEPFVGVPTDTERVGAAPRKPDDVSGFLYGPVYTVDTTTVHRDRIYALWLQNDGSTQRVALRYSNDRGKSWSESRFIAPPSAAGARQYLPAASVNRDGVLGILWFESLPPDGVTYDVFFTASLDGGETFLPPRRVTSAPSRPDHPSNRALTQIGGVRDKAVPVFFSAYSRWKNAGDYTGMTSDVDRVFHPFWPDARRGAFQLYSSRITVERSAPRTRPAHLPDTAVEVTAAVEMSYGSPVAVPAGSDEIILGRVRNASSDTIWGPLTVTVDIPHQPGAAPWLSSTRIYDPRVGTWGTRATISYVLALRDIPFLAPRATTESLEWRFRNASANQLNLNTRVWSGYLTPAQMKTITAEE